MKGFTLVELIVSIAIFALMTALVVARYGTFNQNTILTNMAYDMALTIRTAQTYGLSVKSTDAGNFGSAYGVHFDMSDPTHFTFFADTNGSGTFESSGPVIPEAITKYTLTQGAKISKICVGSDPNNCSSVGSSAGTLDVTYKRPNPNAIFCVTGDSCPAMPNTAPGAFVFITSSDGTKTDIVYIRKNGQISVNN